ncbi:MAG: DUF4844 domain-containing protein [Gammaproteobacteria bacterium]|nr:DUF4844 domain-containing protein [Gammaproteobacteria bacterium]MBU1480105.1 DUF4844 domain-containing protein [Gammaproteobacteria bacterium]
MVSIVLKVLVALIAIAVLVLAIGLSGASFFLWPTNLSDQALKITPEVLAELQKLKEERKFGEDKKTFYPGAPNEAIRASAQASVDVIIQSLVTELPANPRRSVVLSTFKRALSGLERHDSEERDQFLIYLERIMSIVGVTNSGELLNVWRYGFPYGWFQRA